MKRANPIGPIAVLLFAMFIFQSCANIDVVKRRYRPGFHVDITRPAKGQRPDADRSVEQAFNTEHHTRELNSSTTLNSIEPEKALSASLQTAPVKALIAQQPPEQEPHRPILDPVREMKAELLGDKLRRAVFHRAEEEKEGWSVPAIVSSGLATFAWGFIIAGLVLVFIFLYGGPLFYWWIFTLIGFLAGVAAMVTGIVGLRQTGRGEKRGRGFALAGMIGGIVAMVGGLITLFWALIAAIVNNDL